LSIPSPFPSLSTLVSLEVDERRKDRQGLVVSPSSSFFSFPPSFFDSEREGIGEEESEGKEFLDPPSPSSSSPFFFFFFWEHRSRKKGKK